MSSSSETAKRWINKIIENLTVAHEIVYGQRKRLITDLVDRITRASACCDDLHGCLRDMKEEPSENSGWITHREDPYNCHDVESKITDLQKDLDSMFKYFKGKNEGNLMEVINQITNCRELAQKIEAEIQFWEYICQQYGKK